MSGKRADIVIRRYDFHVGAATLSDDRWFSVWVPSVVSGPPARPGAQLRSAKASLPSPGIVPARVVPLYIYSLAIVQHGWSSSCSSNEITPPTARPRAPAATARAL